MLFVYESIKRTGEGIEFFEYKDYCNTLIQLIFVRFCSICHCYARGITNRIFSTLLCSTLKIANVEIM